ncbi:MAG: TolC family protein [Longimicrobiales bacterium]
MSNRRAIVLLVAALLCGPAAGAAQAQRAEAAQKAAAATSPRTLSLEQAITLALDHNRTLEQARLGLGTARQQVREAWSTVYPDITLSSTFTRNLEVPVNFLPARIFDPDAAEDELVGVQFGSDNLWAFQVNAEQPLFEASAFVGLGAAARYESLQEEVLRGVAQQTVTEVRIAFYDVLLAQESVRLNGKSLDRIAQSLAETQAMNRAGLAADYDVLRLEIEYANVEPNVRRSQNALSAAQRELAVLVGLEGSDTLRVEGSWADVASDLVAWSEGSEPAAGGSIALLASSATSATLADDHMQELVADALARRSDVRQLELTQQLRHTELRVEQAEYLPKVYLFGTYSVNAQDNGSPSFFGGDDGVRAYGKQVGVRVSMPLFQGFMRPARVQQREYAVEQAGAQLRLAREEAGSQVRTLAEQVREAAERAVQQRQAVQRAERGYEIARTQYREGLSSQLEVTDVELALRQTEFNYAQAVYDYLTARAFLDAAAGAVPFVDPGARLILGTQGQ